MTASTGPSRQEGTRDLLCEFGGLCQELQYQERLHGRSEGSNRSKESRKFTKMDVAYLHLNARACSRSTGVLLGQLQQYVIAISDDLDAVSPLGKEPAGNDLQTRFKMGQMRCRSQQILYEIDIFRESVTEFVCAESIVRKTIERRKSFASGEDLKKFMERSVVEEIESGRKYG